MSEFFRFIMMYYFISFGVLIGGSLFSGVGAFFTREPPIFTILEYADKLKVWALVVALGGTFDSFRIFETGIFAGNISSLFKQIFYIVVALFGAYSGQLVLIWLLKGDMK